MTNDLLSRLWVYQGERFPLKRTVPLVAVFASAGVTLSASLSARPVPPAPAYMVAVMVAIILFAQLRIADEIKDATQDRLYRPERPVPRGLVTLRTLVRVGCVGAAVQAVLALLLAPKLLLVLCAVWAWLALMSCEFFVPAWLRARPIAYMVTHMMIMPMIDLFTTACEWLPQGGGPPPALLPFLLLSFANGCVLEVGRKTWSPGSEREGVETYSRLWGAKRATMVWMALLSVALVLACGTGMAAGAGGIVTLACAVAALPCVFIARRFLADPTPAAQARLDTASGLWVLASYASVGFLPLLGHHP